MNLQSLKSTLSEKRFDILSPEAASQIKGGGCGNKSNKSHKSKKSHKSHKSHKSNKGGFLCGCGY